jgi:hypothetical protein
MALNTTDVITAGKTKQVAEMVDDLAVGAATRIKHEWGTSTEHLVAC